VNGYLCYSAAEGDKKMDIIKAYSFRSFVIIMFFMALICLLVDSTFYVILTNAEVVLSGHKNLIDLVVMLEEKLDYIMCRCRQGYSL